MYFFVGSVKYCPTDVSQTNAATAVNQSFDSDSKYCKCEKDVQKCKHLQHCTPAQGETKDGKNNKFQLGSIMNIY